MRLVRFTDRNGARVWINPESVAEVFADSVPGRTWVIMHGGREWNMPLAEETVLCMLRGDA